MKLLVTAPILPSPPRYGGQRRMHGLLSALGRRHELTVVAHADPLEPQEEGLRATSAYCKEVLTVPNELSAEGARKRLLQLRSLASLHSFEWQLYHRPAFQAALDGLLERERFDLVNVEFPYHGHYRYAPKGGPTPVLVMDEHNLEYEVLRQVAASEAGLGRRIYNSVNWLKLRREEVASWRRCDGVAFTSVRDQEAAAAALPGLSSVVVPNAVDLEFFKPSPQDPAPDGQTVLFFGAINYYPNQDGILFFLQEVWPRIEKTHPRARLKIVGHKPPPAILAARGPRVEITGFVEDLRPHLSAAAALIVPLRIGSGTRLKIVEGMAMAKACVSTTLGAEGLDVAHERELLIADDAAGFAAQVGRLLDDPQLASRLGAAARSLVQGRYGWEAAAVELERFYQRLVEQRGESGRRGHT